MELPKDTIFAREKVRSFDSQIKCWRLWHPWLSSTRARELTAESNNTQVMSKMGAIGKGETQ